MLLDTSPLLISSSLPIDVELVAGQRFMHIPGQPAAIRFFDPESVDDFLAMVQILKGKETKKWMEDANRIPRYEYREWAGSDDGSSFLFSVHDTRVKKDNGMPVRGFVYLYSEFRERRRVQKMVDRGLILPAEGSISAFEISFAVSPLNGTQSGSGLISSAVRQACLQVKTQLKPLIPSDLLIFAFADQENIPSHHTLESGGFIKKGVMKYDHDSFEESIVYTLDWPLLEEKIKSKLA